MANDLPFPANDSEQVPCVKDLIRPDSKRGGCPCAKCRVERGEPPESAPVGEAPAERTAPARDGKMAAAGDDSEEVVSQEEADRIYFAQRRNKE